MHCIVKSKMLEVGSASKIRVLIYLDAQQFAKIENNIEKAADPYLHVWN